MVMQVRASQAASADVTTDSNAFVEATEGKLAVGDWRAGGFRKKYRG